MEAARLYGNATIVALPTSSGSKNMKWENETGHRKFNKSVFLGRKDRVFISFSTTFTKEKLKFLLTITAGKCPLGFSSSDFPNDSPVSPFLDPSKNVKFENSGNFSSSFSESESRSGKTARAYMDTANQQSDSTKTLRSPYSASPSAFIDKPDEIEYWPQKDQMPYGMITGLRILNPEDDWLEIDEFYEEEMVLRRDILQTRKLVVLGEIDLPDVVTTQEANWEVLDKISSYLTERYPDRFFWSGSVLCNRSTGEKFDLADRKLDSLDTISRLVQEDICVLVDDKNGIPRMVSGAVLFPWRWWMNKKLGLTLRAIHGPVPLYQKLIAKPVDSFFTNLKVDKPSWRIGWSVTDSPSLYQATNEDDDMGQDFSTERPKSEGPIRIEDAGSQLFYRVERQTFVRLPKTGAIIFTIRTYVKPLNFLRNRPEIAAKFLSALSTMDPRVAKYRGITEFHGTAVEYVKKCANGEFLN